MYTFPWNVDTYGSAVWAMPSPRSGNETDSTNNVQPVVILSSDGNTNYQGAKGSAINSLYRRAPNDAGRLQRASGRVSSNTRRPSRS